MSLTLPTTRYVPKYGSLVYLAVEGDTVETVTVSSTSKPAGSVFTAWEALGCIETGTVELIREPGEVVHCFNATTGIYEQIRTENTDADTRLRFNLTVQSVTPFLLELAYAAASVNGTTGAYSPGTLAGGAVKGWLKVQTQVGTEMISVLDIWAEVILAEPAMIANRTTGWKPVIQATQLKAAGDLGAFGTD